jgi:hypothetical protein
MDKRRLLFLIGLILIAFWAGAQDLAPTECIVKVQTKWGAPCGRCEAYTADMKRDDSGTFQVELQNTCREVMELKVAVQEKNGNWRIFPLKALGPQQTMNAYACHGNGKYMYWVRRVNDTEIKLPTDQEILTEYRTR